jgi:hypothetical protein
MADDTQWANVIRAEAHDDGVQRVIEAIPSDPAIAGVPSGGGNDPLDRLMR